MSVCKASLTFGFVILFLLSCPSTGQFFPRFNQHSFTQVKTHRPLNVAEIKKPVVPTVDELQLDESPDVESVSMPVFNSRLEGRPVANKKSFLNSQQLPVSHQTSQPSTQSPVVKGRSGGLLPSIQLPSPQSSKSLTEENVNPSEQFSYRQSESRSDIPIGSVTQTRFSSNSRTEVQDSPGPSHQPSRSRIVTTEPALPRVETDEISPPKGKASGSSVSGRYTVDQAILSDQPVTAGNLYRGKIQTRLLSRKPGSRGTIITTDSQSPAQPSNTRSQVQDPRLSVQPLDESVETPNNQAYDSLSSGRLAAQQAAPTEQPLSQATESNGASSLYTGQIRTRQPLRQSVYRGSSASTESTLPAQTDTRSRAKVNGISSSTSGEASSLVGNSGSLASQLRQRRVRFGHFRQSQSSSTRARSQPQEEKAKVIVENNYLKPDLTETPKQTSGRQVPRTEGLRNAYQVDIKASVDTVQNEPKQNGNSRYYSPTVGNKVNSFPATQEPSSSNNLNSQLNRQGENVPTFIPELNPLNKQKTKVQQLPESPDSASLPITQDFLPTCPDDTFSYIIPSPIQCDLYYLCEYGIPSKKLCEDGLVFSIEEVKCVAIGKEKCEGRPHLQSPKGSGQCLRRNGIFYTNETCTDYVTCRDNHPSHGQCATGLVFDPEQKICAWADEALRPGCLPEDLLGFRCPNPKLTKEQVLTTRVYLRFGDHDRFADEKDCRFFFMCLTTGQPRRAGCGIGKVFDRSTGICRQAKDVPECADYYGPVSATKDQQLARTKQDSRLLLIQDDLSKQFQNQRRLSKGLRFRRFALEEDALPEGR